MATRRGAALRAFIGRLIALAILCWAGPSWAGLVTAEDYQAFWLWAGVKPQPVLRQAQEMYLLAGEVRERRGGGHVHVIAQRSATPPIVNAVGSSLARNTCW